MLLLRYIFSTLFPHNINHIELINGILLQFTHPVFFSCFTFPLIFFFIHLSRLPEMLRTTECSIAKIPYGYSFSAFEQSIEIIFIWNTNHHSDFIGRKIRFIQEYFGIG